MRTVEITKEAIAELAASAPRNTPITMLNLLRYRQQAHYANGSDLPPCSGREVYMTRYAAAVTPLVIERGARIIWSGSVAGHPVCPDDERWDDILIVEYPDSDSITGLLSDPAYLAQVHHRTAALEDSRLITMLQHDP